MPLYRTLAAVLLAGAMLLAGESSCAMLASVRLSCSFLQFVNISEISIHQKIRMLRIKTKNNVHPSSYL